MLIWKPCTDVLKIKFADDSLKNLNVNIMLPVKELVRKIVKTIGLAKGAIEFSLQDETGILYYFY